MKIEFITEEVSIGDLWDSVLSKEQDYFLDNEVVGQKKAARLHLMTYEGVRETDQIFKTFGKTVKLTFDSGSSIEGLPEHKLMRDDWTWVQIGELKIGDSCLSQEKEPVRVTDVQHGCEQDVYDVCVPIGHHYIANGMISHNSTLAAQLGINWSQMGEHVCMVPLEMSEKEMTARVMANASSLDVRKILHKKLSSNEKELYLRSYKKFVTDRKKEQGTLSFFKPKSDMTIEEILACTYTLGPRIIVIDYISLLKGVDGDDAWQKLGQVARYCKIYAEIHHLLIVMLCQVNEEGEIRYAKSIREHSNYMWSFYANKETREAEILNIVQQKARNGELFDFSLATKMAFMQVRGMSKEEKDNYQSKSNTHNKNKGKSGSGSDSKKAKKEPSYLKDISDEDDD
jgi:hypothetical protein